MFPSDFFSFAHWRYTRSASDARTVKVAFPPETIVDSNVSTPPMTQVPLEKVCPPKEGFDPWSTLELEFAAVNLFDLRVLLPSPVRMKFWAPLVPLPE